MGVKLPTVECQAWGVRNDGGNETTVVWEIFVV